MIKSIEIINLSIPFLKSFKHNTASRTVTQSIIVIVGDGTTKGYGEGCPREYVTNETVSSAFSFFESIKNLLQNEVIDLVSLEHFRTKHTLAILKNPSAWCAVELAVLDLLAKQNKCSIEKLLGKLEISGAFKYSAIIGDENFDTFVENVQLYTQMGFSDYKIKISGNAKADYEKLNFINQTNAAYTIRVDGNNLWKNATDVLDYIKGLPCTITAIEEPLEEKNISALKKLARTIEIPIILDESFCNIKDVEQVLDEKKLLILNLRVSKNGGLLNAFKLSDVCLKEGVKVIIGAQVGETSILTRAGISVANVLKPNYIAQEGGFGTKLLLTDIVSKPLMFGDDGILRAEELLSKEKFGLELDIQETTIVKAP
jgi:L-Ala-D/L-Glu epimerase